MVTALLLLSGSYLPMPGAAGPELCPHEVRVNAERGFLSVSYAGDCGGQGPFRYDCFEGGSDEGPRTVTCLDGLVEFEILSQDRYLWRNRGYGFEGTFVRTE